MKSQRRLIVSVIACVLIAAGSVYWSACSVSARLGVSAFGAGNGAMKIYLTDASATYDSVVVFISRVEVIGAGKSETEWSVVRGDEARFDLLSLRNGQRMVLGSHPLADGHYTQIRLILSRGSYVVDGGVKYPLIIPTGMETGIKLNHEFDIVDGKEYEVLMDFDASASIRMTGSGQYVMNPIIKISKVAAL